MLNIILFGPPGSGKGTQALKLAEKYNLIHISTGDLLRGEISNKTQLGLEAKKFMDAGNLVPDEVVIGMIDNKLTEHKNAEGVIFDGFPRTIPQAEALDQLLKEKGTAISVVLYLKVSDEEITKRILKRGETSGRADDKNEEVIAKRIKVYKEETSVVGKYYKKQGKFEGIEGEGSIDDIFSRLTNKIEKLAQV